MEKTLITERTVTIKKVFLKRNLYVIIRLFPSLSQLKFNYTKNQLFIIQLISLSTIKRYKFEFKSQC